MMQVPTIQPQQALAPNYNAVKIDINNPQVSTPQSISQPQVIPSMYDVPKASVYEVPQQSVYQPNQNFNQPPTAQQTPSVPTPVIVPPAVTPAPVAPAPVATTPAPVAAPAQATVEAAAVAPETKAPETAAPQAIEVKSPEVAKPQVDVNAFIARLTNDNYEEQANAMETIADMAQNSPQQATALLDTRVIDSLLGIMNKDTSKLQGPTPKQLEIREKIINNKPVTEAETKEANVITPMEQAERNKQYAMYTAAILQKLFATEVQKMNNSVVPLTELPGSAAIVEQVKSNPNPMVRASAIDSLSYIQAPEYKQDLETIFTVAQKDKDSIVQKTAEKALEKLKQMPQAEVAATNATTEPAKAKA